VEKLSGVSDADKILRDAFLTLSRDVLSGSNCFNGPASPSTSPEKLTPYDRLTNAVYVILRAQEAVPEPFLTYITAYYTVPIKESYSDKEEAIEFLAYRVGSNIKADHWYIVDCVRRYCNSKPHHQDLWWCNHTGKHRQTLWRIRKKCCKNLDDIAERTLSILSGVIT